MPVKPEPAQPNVPSFAEDLTPVAPLKGAPTPADYAKEWGTYRAAHDLVIDGSLAVPKGGAVPASHPLLRDSEDGPGWVTQDAVELTGDHDAPTDLRRADISDAPQDAVR